MTNTSLDSLKDTFGDNLNKLFEYFGYTPTSFVLKLNSFLNEDAFSAFKIYCWLNKRMDPSIYDVYCVASFFNLKMDCLLDPTSDINILVNKIIEPQNQMATELLVTQSLVTAETSSKENNQMANTNNRVITISNKSYKQMKKVTEEHTNFTDTSNILLVNKLYNTNTTLRYIADNVGKSTRSLRDYAFYNTSVPADTAQKLVKFFKTSYRNLGLVYNADTNRYDHMVVKSK